MTESMTSQRVDLSVPLMHHDPDRSWIRDPVPDHPKGMHPQCCRVDYSGIKHPIQGEGGTLEPLIILPVQGHSQEGS